MAKNNIDDVAYRIAMELKPEGDYEVPSESCLNCFIAEWIDMYGVWVYCCDMSHCIMDDELY